MGEVVAIRRESVAQREGVRGGATEGDEHRVARRRQYDRPIGELPRDARAAALRELGWCVDEVRWPASVPPGCGGVVWVDGRPYAGFGTRGEALAAVEAWRDCWPALHGRRVEVRS